ncbi:F-box protein AUF1-like [Bidens hawaiensis]|uniref:F-box protein AUF1-like n=1 Tax=Bidens hawaiensis TaxID=980011 RepID=UPI00404B03B4
MATSISISTVDPSHSFRPLNPPEYHSDDFDRLPDPLILTILNNISDIKTLIRCRTLSRRFNSLVPQSDSLLLRVDRVISTVDSDDHGDTPSVINFIKSVVKSIQDLISPHQSQTIGQSEQTHYSPAMILRGFERIKDLEIELPTGDLWLEKRAAIKWTAEFGKTLKSCVILGFRCGGVGESDLGGGGGLKTRVVWTISALIAASARHYMVKEIVKQNPYLKKLIVNDKENEGSVVMNELGIKEYREEEGQIGNLSDEQEGQNGNLNGGGVWWRSSRTRVPAVWMRMRHEAKLELSNGVVMEGATLVVVRPTGSGIGANVEAEEERWDEGVVAKGGGFDGVYGEAVAKLIKRRSYLLEMNSF